MIPANHFYGDLADLLQADEYAALVLLRDRFGVDLSRTYQFWERVTATMLAGTTTPAGCGWDVELEGIRVEVKFSQEFGVRFTAGPRRVFKWAGLTRQDAHVTVLYGVDPDDHVSLWVVPSALLGGTATVVSPRTRRAVGGRQSPLDGWHVPLDQLLPAVLRCARL